MPGWPEGVARHVLPRAASTNAEGLRLAPALRGPAWIMAQEQTAGRGRRGRSWQMLPGNFAATLILHPNGPATEAAQFSFVAALALYDALADAVGPQARLSIKWPNDLLLNGGKVAGILLESAGAGGMVQHLAIGIGVNLAAAPGAELVEPDAARPASVAAETGISIEPDAFLDLLAPAFAAWQARLAEGGFAEIRRAWMARAARLGQPITARTMRETVTGIFEGIDGDGAMILSTPQGQHIVPAADVFF
ncbi:biotin--[acetyl-CoA-carboxylase] ligase [Paracoccus pacificus]|uniref:biotin--[biotin carboxyl-carrier protein] ligase n=1 Tax=Paracoccus pacificus TaxID=1463598 RepID=A0ABW4RC91_9RHOB